MPAEATVPGANGKIVFASDRSGAGFEIFVMNPDGSAVTQLTTNTAGDLEPSWSPDGSKIAFASDRDTDYEIYVMNADGTAVTQLTFNSASDNEPCWSPDGEKIVFVSDRDGDDEIYTMRTDGTGLNQLTVNDKSDRQPCWSPDGSKIVFSSNRDGDYETYVMNADGTAVTQLTFNSASDNEPCWSPDGAKIVFASDRSGAGFEIFVMNPDGSAVTQLTTNTAGDLEPSWSPDGSKIVFNSNRDGDNEIYVMNSDGTGLNQLTINNVVIDQQPAWQPVVTTPPPTQIVVRFSTVPAGTGTIIFNSTSYADGSSVTARQGTYSLRANPAVGYVFLSWETVGSVFVSDPTLSLTTCIVYGSGTIRMMQEQEQTPTPPTETPPTTPPPTETTTPPWTTSPPPTETPPQRLCVIATAAYGSPLAPEVVYMRHVRDNMIASNEAGRTLVNGWNLFYYLWSPPVAQFVATNHPLQPVARVLLVPLVGVVHVTAYIYDLATPVSAAFASVTAFTLAAILAAAIYVATPSLVIRSILSVRAKRARVRPEP
ncbi:PD40 domain-containing protein [Candidatus Bathyarchaeota archaeon]|nr:PD40 domain-containing protein [Candidatus Bathyarchaeota archaeon]